MGIKDPINCGGSHVRRDRSIGDPWNGEYLARFCRGFANQARKKKLGDSWSNVYFDTIYYANVFQEHQTRAFNRIKSNDDIDWISLRNFLLFEFSDAAGLERKAVESNSAYEKVQNIILDILDRTYDVVGGAARVILIAHSLGC